MSAGTSDGLKQLAVVLPALQPTALLVSLATALRDAGFGLVLVVDDGSTGPSRGVFDALEQQGFPVLHHAVNLGKGRALKSAFAVIRANYPDVRGVITADADGQHTVRDIVRVARELHESLQTAEPKPVLGVRSLHGDVPLRSRFGNAMTRLLFPLATGVRLRDTQSGLRGFPAALLSPLCQLRGERYEYELAVLVHLCRNEQCPLEVPIETVYMEANRTSHFRPLPDSWRVYTVLARAFLGRIVSP